MKKLMTVGLLLVAVNGWAVEKKEMPKEFYIYEDAGSRLNHFCPGNWMGATRAMKMSQNWTIGPKEGKSCIRIDYDVQKDTQTLWCGIFWAQPCSNWGNMKGGYDLTGYKKLTFWARGQGLIDKFGVGGITGQTEEGDSTEVATDAIELTPEWTQYTIDLKGEDLHKIIGGFLFAANADSNYKLKSVVLFLDEVRFER